MEVYKKLDESTQKSGWLIYKRLIRIALQDNATPVTIAIFGMIITALSDPALSAIMKPILDGGFIERDQSVISLLPLGLFSIYSRIKGSMLNILRSQFSFIDQSYRALVQQEQI